MATLPFIQSNNLNLDTPGHTELDYSFLENHAQRAAQMHEASVSQLQNDYNSVLNAPITSAENIAQRDVYITQAKDQLKKITAMDISMPQNVQQLEQAFAPFWQDNDLLTDIAKTKRAQNEYQRYLSARDSKDDDIRATASDNTFESLNQLQLNNLRNAKRGDGSIAATEIDSWIPTTNIPQYLDKHRIDDKMEVVTTVDRGDGSYSVITNGPGSISNYKVYADGNLGNEFNAQYTQKAKLSKERMALQYQADNPGATRKDALNYIGSQQYENARNIYNNLINIHQSTIDSKSTLLNRIQQQVKKVGGKPTGEQATQINNLMAELNTYNNKKSHYESTLNNLEGDKQGFMLYPETVLAQQYRLEDIDKFAQGSAAMVKEKIEVNQSFWNNVEHKDRMATLRSTNQQNIAENEISRYNAQTNRMNALTSDRRLSLEFSDVLNLQGDAVPIGKGINDQFKVDGIVQTDAVKDALRAGVYQSIYDPRGTSKILNDIPMEKASGTDINAFRESMSRYFSGQPISDKLLGGYNKVVSFLHDETGIDIKTQTNADKAFRQYTTKYFNEAHKTGAIDPAELLQLKDKYNTEVIPKLNTLEQDDAQRQQNLTNFIKTPQGQKLSYLTRIDAQGNVRPINTQDISKDIQPIQAFNKAGQPVTLSPQQVAEAWISGNFHYNDGSSLKKPTVGIQGKDGERYTLATLPNGLPVTDVKHNVSFLVHKYGGTDLKDKLKTVNESTVQNTDLFRKKENEQAEVYQYNIINNEGKVNQNAANRLRAAIEPQNHTAVYDATTKKPIENNSEVEAAIRNALNDPKIQDKIGASYKHHLIGFTGKPMLRVDFQEIGKGDENIRFKNKDISGKSFYIELTKDSDSKLLQNMHHLVDQSWHPLLNGKSINTDEYQNALTMSKLSVAPYPSTGNPQYYILSGYLSEVNPNTGIMEQVYRTKEYPVSDFTPADIQKLMNNVASQNGSNIVSNTAAHRNIVNKKQQP